MHREASARVRGEVAFAVQMAKAETLAHLGYYQEVSEMAVKLLAEPARDRAP